MFRKKRQQEKLNESALGKAHAIVDVLLKYDLIHPRKPHTVDVITQAIYDQLISPNACFEYVIDDPASSNWRLKPDEDGGIRVADYHMSYSGSLIVTIWRQIESGVNEELRNL